MGICQILRHWCTVRTKILSVTIVIVLFIIVAFLKVRLTKVEPTSQQRRMNTASCEDVREQITATASTHIENTGATASMLVVIIMSAPTNWNRRDIVRTTWMSGYEGHKFYSKFVVGTKNLTTEVFKHLLNENSLHQDLLLLNDTTDSYHKLSYKVLASLIWFDRYVNYSYILKCDDDSFVLLDKIEKDLQERDHTRGLYWGYFMGNNYPKLTGPWAETNWKFCDLYFPYALGGGYVLSADIVHRIVINADALIIYNNEDVSVGAWTVVFDIERRHDVRFDTYGKSRGCKNSFIVTHKQGISDLKDKHQRYTKHGKLCEHEHVLWEDEYNWNVPPSKCYCTGSDC